MGDFGEETRHLDLGLNARAHAPVNLDHDAVVNDDRQVALLDAQRAHHRLLADRRPFRTGIELDPAMRRFDLPAFVDGHGEIADEVFILRGIDECAHARTRPELGEREAQSGGARPHIVAAPLGRKRHEVMLLLSAGQQRIAEDQRIIAMGPFEAGEVTQPEAGEMDILRPEPSLPVNEVGKNVALDGLPLAIAEHRAPPICRDQRNEIRRHLWHRGVPARLLLHALEHEPIEPVGRQRQHVGKLADRRKRGVPGQFDGDRTGVLAQVELHGLRRAREIEDAEQRLAVMLAKKRQHLAIVRIEEFQAAPPERIVALTHLDYAPHPVE